MVDALDGLVEFFAQMLDFLFHAFWYDLDALWYAVNRDKDLTQVSMCVLVVILSAWWLISVEQ